MREEIRGDKEAQGELAQEIKGKAQSLGWSKIPQKTKRLLWGQGSLGPIGAGCSQRCSHRADNPEPSS